MAQDAAVAATGASLASRLLKVAWFAIFLGLALQGVLLLAALGFGQNLELNRIVAELMHKVSWAFLVCFGLALGSAAAKAGPRSFAIAGLLAAPIAFILARALHKSVAQALDVPQGAASESVLVFAFLKAIEYGCLGYLLAKISERFGAGLYSYTTGGLTIGIVFGAIALYLIYPQTTPVMVARGINEIMFPVGCSLVIYAADVLGRRVS